MYRVYDELSVGLKKNLQGLKAIHSAKALIKRNNDDIYDDY